MVVVDLQELEDRALIASESIGGVVLEPEALLLIVSEIRRMKSLLGEQHDHLTDMRGELLQLRTELVSALTRGASPQRPPKSKKTSKVLKMTVVSKNTEKNNGGED
ncbi:MAG: hypothetical protein FWG59_01360 [Betaproteobacteria bacterium]|nr:hypothetical protein [Betaproteobacteria bacterium]